LPGVEVDERAARRSLREQIAKLERELAQAFASAYPRQGFEWGVAGQYGPGSWASASWSASGRPLRPAAVRPRGLRGGRRGRRRTVA
jgi:hypothetical protein